MSTSRPTDVPGEIAKGLGRGQTPEQLIAVGERTGWWTAADVDQVVTPSADGNDELPTHAEHEADRLSELTAELTAAGVVDVDPGPVDPSELSAADFVVLVAGDLVSELGQMSADRQPQASAAEADSPECSSPASTGAGDQVADVVDDDPVVVPAPRPPADLLARGLTHADPKVRAKAERARAAIDALCTALMRRSA